MKGISRMKEQLRIISELTLTGNMNMSRHITCTSQQWYAMMRQSRVMVDKLMTDLIARE